MDIASQTGTVYFDCLNWDLIEQQLHRNEDDTTYQQGKGFLCCVSCGKRITHDDQRLPIRGRHEHRFRNPHGLSFNIGCFASAPGCGQIGTATSDWTWFPGYAWEIALCLGCGAHLGWRYTSRDGDLFYGLILDRLVAEHKH